MRHFMVVIVIPLWCNRCAMCVLCTFHFYVFVGVRLHDGVVQHVCEGTSRCGEL